MPGKYNMTIWRGNDYDVSFSFKKSDGTALDMTDIDVVFRSEWPSGSIRLASDDVPTGSYIEKTSPSGGLVSLHFDPPGTREFPLGKADYEIEFRASGEEVTVLSGSVILVGGVNDDD